MDLKYTIRKTSDVIKALQENVDKHGDLPIATWDGVITVISVGTSKDGVCVEPNETPDEFVVEIRTDG